MNKLIIEQKNNLNILLKQEKQFQVNDEKNLSNLKRMGASPPTTPKPATPAPRSGPLEKVGVVGGLPPTFVNNQISKLTLSINMRSEKINNIETELSRLYSGNNNNEIFKEHILKSTNNAMEIKIKTDIKQEKKKIELLEKQKDSQKNEIHSKSERLNDKIDKHWFYKSAEKDFYKAINSVPDYLSKELKRTPYNQGIVWRGVWFFGTAKNKAYNNKIIESKKGFKIITEWDKKCITVYELRKDIISNKKIKLRN